MTKTAHASLWLRQRAGIHFSAIGPASALAAVAARHQPRPAHRQDPGEARQPDAVERRYPRDAGVPYLRRRWPGQQRRARHRDERQQRWGRHSKALHGIPPAARIPVRLDNARLMVR